ncbi:MAG TPA: hypothetical protein VNA20_12940 [Frankiaceae bacterium]|nr:hypothetical protein [Frankiaceae bacterium]
MRPLVATALALGLLAPNAAFAEPLPLPKPAGEIPIPSAAVADRPERLRRSQVPGGVDDTERIDVLLAPNGTPAAVTLTQRLVLTGTGQFVVWERSSASDVEPLADTDPPVLKREAVIWQGFVNQRKELAARLTLDPFVENELLPLRVELRGPLGPGGTLTGAGPVTVKVSNRTGLAMTLPTGTVAPEHLAGPLDRLRAYATAKRPTPPPAAGRGLPLTLPATGNATREANVVVPFRVTGTVRVTGGTAATPESAAVTHVPGGLRLDGVLAGDAEFTVNATATGTLQLELTAFPTLDPRTLQPPQGATWAEWAGRRPPTAQVAAATTQLVDAAAQAARADDYAPYLGHHGPGSVRTTFHFRMAPPDVVRAAAPRPLSPRPFGIALASLALAGVLTNATVIWRRL